MQIHKIMAGLLDQYLQLGNDLALRMAHEEGLYFVQCAPPAVTASTAQDALSKACCRKDLLAWLRVQHPPLCPAAGT